MSHFQAPSAISASGPTLMTMTKTATVHTIPAPAVMSANRANGTRR